jgi:WD40 repeat protein
MALGIKIVPGAFITSLFLHEQFCHNRHRGYIMFSKGGKMERKKIIIVAALAVGIIAWRMGAMERGQEIVLVCGDKERVSITKSQAAFFEMIEDMIGAAPGTVFSQEIPMPELKGSAVRAVIGDLPWVMQVRNERQEGETEQQAAQRKAKSMPSIGFSQKLLEDRIAQLQAAQFLIQPALIERYKKEIADILTSDDSMHRLARNDTTIIDQVKAALSEVVVESLSNYIFKKYWIAGLTLQGHTNLVKSASFSPDGRKIVTASTDKTAKIWNAGTGALEGTLIGHTELVRSASFSPDGSKIVTASYDRTAKIWNVATGVLEHTLAGHTHEVNSASYSPYGSKIVTASGWGRTATIWNAVTGAEEHTLVGHTNRVESASFSPDGSKIVTASWDGTAKIWNATTGALERTLDTLAGHFDRVKSASFSPDGSKIVTASCDGGVKIWNAQTGALERKLEGHLYGAVNSASYSPDGSKIVTASNDRTAKIWNAATGALEHTLAGHTEALDSASFSPDGSKILTASLDKTAKIWPHLPSSLPGISDFETCLFERLLMWARDKKQKISKMGWFNNILNMIEWQKLRREDQAELKKLIRETVQQ